MFFFLKGDYVSTVRFPERRHHQPHRGRNENRLMYQTSNPVINIKEVQIQVQDLQQKQRQHQFQLQNVSPMTLN